MNIKFIILFIGIIFFMPLNYSMQISKKQENKELEKVGHKFTKLADKILGNSIKSSSFLDKLNQNAFLHTIYKMPGLSSWFKKQSNQEVAVSSSQYFFKLYNKISEDLKISNQPIYRALQVSASTSGSTSKNSKKYWFNALAGVISGGLFYKLYNLLNGNVKNLVEEPIKAGNKTYQDYLREFWRFIYNDNNNDIWSYRFEILNKKNEPKTYYLNDIFCLAWNGKFDFLEKSGAADQLINILGKKQLELFEMALISYKTNKKEI